jgi:hypothetical protein
MEVSFQPLFIEGIPDGSSKQAIRNKPGYNKAKEQLGVASSSSIGGAGPSLSNWIQFIHSSKRDRKRRFGDDSFNANINANEATVDGNPDIMANDADVMEGADADDAPPPMANDANVPATAMQQQQQLQEGGDASAEAKAQPKSKRAKASTKSTLSGSFISGSGASNVRASLLTQENDDNNNNNNNNTTD